MWSWLFAGLPLPALSSYYRPYQRYLTRRWMQVCSQSSCFRSALAIKNPLLHLVLNVATPKLRRSPVAFMNLAAFLAYAGVLRRHFILKILLSLLFLPSLFVSIHTSSLRC